MKNVNLKFLILAASIALSACGPKDKNPTTDFKNLDLSQQAPADRPPFDTTLTQLINIDIPDHRTFTQGEPRSVDVVVRTAFSYPKEVKYKLVLAEGPTDLGLRLNQTESGWKLSWAPGSNILNWNETYREFPTTLQFQLLPTSSERVKREFAPHQDKQSFVLTLNKDSAQPIIEESAKITDIKSTPEQKIKLNFVVAAKGLNAGNDLEINIYAGPEAPTRELIQFDATYGINHKAKMIGNLGADKDGRTRFKYEIEFDAKRYNEALIESLSANKILDGRYKKGEITRSEAAFNFEVQNPYNGMRSVQKLIILDVELPKIAVDQPEVKK